ncbi:MAG TPA: aldolase/citrate lyase family protein, partial [Tepidiformaceae bacterium]|nr:aldolase/citrate lyase family protein [Tepidiformaceae bacterium]
AAHANQEIAVFAMIETADGLANLDEICSTPGLTGVYIGPADLSYALGLPPKTDSEEPAHVAAVARIVETCKRHGIVAGIHTGGPAFSRRCIEQGMGLVTLTSDVVAMTAGAGRMLRQFRGEEPLDGESRGPY